LSFELKKRGKERVKDGLEEGHRKEPHKEKTINETLFQKVKKSSTIWQGYESPPSPPLITTTTEIISINDLYKKYTNDYSVTSQKENLDKFFGLNIIRNAVSHYGMLRLRMAGTKPNNLVQTIENIIKKGGDFKFGVQSSEFRVQSQELRIKSCEL